MNWIPAISTTTLLIVVAWLFRKIISTRLFASVTHEYNKKIESLKADLRKNEDIFKAELKEKESQIDAMRSGALSGIINKQAVLYERQLKAVDQIWGDLLSLTPAKGVSRIMSVIKFENASKEASKNPEFRKFFSDLGNSIRCDEPMKSMEASKARPFITPLAWAYYSAYSAILAHSFLRFKSLQSGLNQDFADVDAIMKLVKEALPDYTAYIDQFGPSAFYYLLNELESKLLNELGKILKGENADKESLERAASIIRETENLLKANEALEKS